MRVANKKAQKVAKHFAEEILERVESELGFQLSDEQWADAIGSMEEAISESITDVFEAL